MERIAAILSNKDYIKNFRKNIKAEADRIFCKHDMDHFLDVARIAYIINLEECLGYRKDIIYAAALLHDIGKWRQYREAIPHAQASACLAQEILLQCGFCENETEIIVEAILNHSRRTTEDRSFRYLLYKSDKLSRKCFLCPASKECNWENKMKNNEIEV